MSEKLQCPDKYESATGVWESCSTPDHCAGCGGTFAEHLPECETCLGSGQIPIEDGKYYTACPECITRAKQFGQCGVEGHAGSPTAGGTDLKQSVISPQQESSPATVQPEPFIPLQPEQIHRNDGTAKQPANTAGEKWRDPVQADLDDPLFEAIWQAIRTWDVNVPDQYVGYCGANGNHAVVILDKVRAEIEKRPGNHRQILIAACRKAFEAIDAIPHGQTIRPSSTRQALREAWLACRDALQDVRTVEVEHTQPACPKCAELEKDLGFAAREIDRLKSIHAREVKDHEAAAKERDDLKAKCEAMERGIKNQERVMEVCNQQFRDAAKQVEHLWPEAERPVGIQMICHKLAEMEKALRAVCSESYEAPEIGASWAVVKASALDQASAALAGVVKAAEPEHTPHKEEQK